MRMVNGSRYVLSQKEKTSIDFFRFLTYPARPIAFTATITVASPMKKTLEHVMLTRMNHVLRLARKATSLAQNLYSLEDSPPALSP